ncbi:MAG: phosphatase PAP2 family protein [Bacteroidales bacterium]
MLEHLDQQLFLYINSHNSPFWDQVMYLVSGRLIWAPLYIAILVWLGVKFKKKFYVLLLAVAVTIAVSDRLSVAIKNTVKRPRPCHEKQLEGRVHLVKGKCGGAYGFVSSHATNSFTVALFSLLFIREKWFKWSMIIWATVIGFSRIYLGVHYPGDVICGSILGILTGWGAYTVFQLVDRKYLSQSKYFSTATAK